MPMQELKYNLNEVTLNTAGNKAYYIYDTNGERVRKVVIKSGIKEERFYIGDYEYYTKDDTIRETLKIQDNKQVVALIDTQPLHTTQDTLHNTHYTIILTTTRYQLTNHLESASLELNETGEIISYEEYHPFGTTSYRSGRNEIDISLKTYL